MWTAPQPDQAPGLDSQHPQVCADGILDHAYAFQSIQRNVGDFLHVGNHNSHHDNDVICLDTQLEPVTLKWIPRFVRSIRGTPLLHNAILKIGAKLLDDWQNMQADSTIRSKLWATMLTVSWHETTMKTAE